MGSLGWWESRGGGGSGVVRVQGGGIQDGGEKC